MTTVKDKLLEMLIERGMFLSQANAVIDLCIPVIDKQASEINGTKTKNNITTPVCPYKISWDAPSYTYGEEMYNVWFATVIKKTAFDWLTLNKPHAWNINVFK